jgi:hypothetical protein
MKAYGSILYSIQQMLDDDSDETLADIRRHINTAYQRIAEQRNWTTLTKQITGMSTILPGDLVRIIYVEDDTDYYYFDIDFPARYQSGKLYNYFKNMTVSTPLLTGTDGVPTLNSTTFTSAAAGFTAAMVGEYIRIGVDGGIYKISAFGSTSSITLDAGYRGATTTAQYFEIRPVGTMQIAYTDEDGDALTTSSTLKLWYLAKPLPVYNLYDMVLLPGDCEAVRIMTMRLMLESQKYVNDSIKSLPDFNEAYALMRSLDKTPSRYRRPRNTDGTMTRFGRHRQLNSRYSRDGSIYL